MGLSTAGGAGAGGGGGAPTAVFPLPGSFPWANSSRGKPRRGMMRRAVFSDLQRKGLEKRFQIQKYISKPDRKKLAEKLGLKDSQGPVQCLPLRRQADGELAEVHKGRPGAAVWPQLSGRRRPSGGKHRRRLSRRLLAARAPPLTRPSLILLSFWACCPL
ncbi:H2.0-like homeobox protein [Schistocerca nitens]|uniref:H2.0-like homeobox protein n=1 Tax=Schistocerca nitens TaxID=7011 RepID=UPI0021192D55|nr:H2.0-like homeobox protein [Schistocerca nitens]